MATALNAAAPTGVANGCLAAGCGQTALGARRALGKGRLPAVSCQRSVGFASRSSGHLPPHDAIGRLAACEHAASPQTVDDRSGMAGSIKSPRDAAKAAPQPRITSRSNGMLCAAAST